MPVNRKSTISLRHNQKLPEQSLLQSTTQQCLVRHPMFPSVPHPSTVSFLLMNLLFSLTATVFQYINLSQTVWWLPSSLHDNAVDVKSIDYYLLWHITLMVVTPYVYIIIVSSTNTVLPYPFLRSILFLPVFTCWLYFVFQPLLHVDISHFSTPVYRVGAVASFGYIPLLAIVIYHDEAILRLYSRLFSSRIFLGFWSSKTMVNNAVKKCNASKLILGASTNIKRLVTCIFSAMADWPALSPSSCFFPVRYFTDASSSAGSTSRRRLADFWPTTFFYTRSQQVGEDKAEAANRRSPPATGISTTTSIRGLVLLQHQCVAVRPESVRSEVETYRRDFNSRLTDVLFGTLYTTYYTCVLPVVFFKPADLYYDSTWCLQHTVTVALVAFLLRWTQCLPPDYLDLLHRCCKHLGAWQPVEPPNATSANAAATAADHSTASAHTGTPTIWSPIKIYPRGTVVRHLRCYYRSLGESNAAEPGKSHHRRFYMLFHDLVQVSVCLLTACAGLIAFQLANLYWVFEWYKLLGLTGVACFASFCLYYSARNCRLVYGVYSGDIGDGVGVGDLPVVTLQRSPEDVSKTSAPVGH